MDHLDEMARPGRPCVDVALLRTRVVAVAAIDCARYRSQTRRESRENGIEMIDHRFFAADHHAVAAIKPPHPARRPDIDKVDAALREILGAMDIVLVEAVAAIDDDIARRSEVGDRGDHRLGRLAGRQHHPVDRRLVELAAHVGQPRGTYRSFSHELGNRLGRAVVDYGVMAVPDQPPGYVCTHAAEPDDADLHFLLRLATHCGEGGRIELAISARPSGFMMLEKGVDTRPR